MNRLRPFFVGLVIALLFGFALWLRIFPPFHSIFTPEGVRFSTVDAYYHMYIVDNLAFNFPRLSDFMPYLTYPGGQGSPAVYFFNWLLAAVIWIISMGKPTAHLIDVVGAYYPAVLGALTIIPVYFIGKAVIGRWAGVIGAALLSVLPGEFIGRSILGSTDQHVVETLLTAVAIMFLILALKAARENKLTVSQFKDKNWPAVVKPLGFSLLAGFFLGLYLLAWFGALLFVFTIFVFFTLQFFIDHLRRQSTDYLSLVSFIVFAVAAVMVLPVMNDSLYLSAMLIAVFVPVVFNLLSRFLAKKEVKPVYFPLSIIGIGLAGIGVIYLAAPSLFQLMLTSFSIFHPTGAALTTLEMQPILVPTGSFTLALVWGNFTASFFVALIALLLLIYLAVKKGEPDKTLLLVWGVVMLAATIGQRRFAYYFAVNAAVLTGFFSAWIMEKCGLINNRTSNENSLFTVTIGIIAILFLVPSLSPDVGFLNPFTWIAIPAMVVFFVALFLGSGKKTEREIRARRNALAPAKRFSVNPSVVNMVLALILIFLTVLFPNVATANQTAKGASFAPNDAWMESLTWMKNNTPEPFGNPDYYYQIAANASYPPSAYGVLSWWDYGYWITRIAHRIPNVNPSQDAALQKKVGSIFVAQNESEADELVRSIGSAYVVIDDQTALGKFWAVATWAGKSPNDYSEQYYMPQQSGTQTEFVPIHLYYPAYYQSLVIRLFNFEGRALAANLSASQVAAVSQWLIGKTPSSPTALNATAGSGSSIDLVWSADDITNLSGFRIERAADSGFSSGVVSILGPAGSTHYTDVSTEPDTTYYYRVFAFNSLGESGASNSVSVASGNLDNTQQPPAAPTSANASAMGTTAVTVMWTDNSANETGFRIDRSTTNSFSANLSSVIVGSNIVAWTDTNIDGNTTYYYRIVAYSAGGHSAASNTASVSIAGGTNDARLIYAANCASCHGPDRQGTENYPPLTASALAGKSFDQLNRTIAEGTIKGMPGFQTHQVFVVTYEERNADATHTVKLITDAQPFDSYEAASAYLNSQTSGNHRIVGPNPFVSPVPLAALQNYKLVFGSASVIDTGVGATSQVKIFQYTGNLTSGIR